MRSFWEKCKKPLFLGIFFKVFCRNTNGTCLKSVSKTPTSRFSGISSYSSIQPNLGQIWVNIGQKGPFFKFPRKNKAVIFFGLQRLGFLQKIRKFQCGVFEKNVKTPIFGYFGPKRPILDHFWPKRGHFRIFGEKAKTSLFYSFFSFFNTNKRVVL